MTHYHHNKDIALAYPHKVWCSTILAQYIEEVKRESLPIQDEPERFRQLVYDWDMQLIMNDESLQTIEQVRQFLEGSEAVEFRGLTAKEKYSWIEEVLIRFRYHRQAGQMTSMHFSFSSPPPITLRGTRLYLVADWGLLIDNLLLD